MIPQDARKYKTAFPFVINVFPTSVRTEKPTRSLLCCAYTAEQRREWIQTIRARIFRERVYFIQFKPEDLLAAQLERKRQHRLQQSHTLTSEIQRTRQASRAIPAPSTSTSVPPGSGLSRLA